MILTMSESQIKRVSPRKFTGNVTLTTYAPAQIAFMRARIDEGATNKEIEQEFGVSCHVASAVRKTTLFNSSHVKALKKGLPDAFASVAAASLSAINPKKLEACSAPQLAMVAGVATDKMRLLQGESTANVSFKDAGHAAIQHVDTVAEVLKSMVGSLPDADK